jgi:MOSC domain-containing protein YiiM
MSTPAEDSLVQKLLRQRAMPGRLVWIGLRQERRGPVHEVETAELITERGLKGDRATRNSGGKRQVTLLQHEHLPVIAALSGRDAVPPAWLRRNLVISGFCVLALRAKRFRLGETILEGTGTCDPCSRMEEVLGVGGYNAMRGHGGITARVIQGGTLRLGDELDFLQSP